MFRLGAPRMPSHALGHPHPKRWLDITRYMGDFRFRALNGHQYRGSRLPGLTLNGLSAWFDPALPIPYHIA